MATSKESHAAAPPQHPAPAAASKKRPASPAAEAQEDTRPLHDDALPPDVVEEGKIYFFYKPRVTAAPKQESGGGGASSASAAATAGHVSSLDDVQRTFMLLSPMAVSDRNVGEGRKALAEAEAHDPQHGRPLSRIFVIPKKALPGSGAGEPRLAICVGTAESAGELTKGLEASTYTTKTRGERLQPPGRVVARGHYVIVAPTAGPVARAVHHAQQHGEATEEEDDEQQPKRKAPKAYAGQTPAEKLAAAAASGRHGRPVRSARLLWLLDAPAHGPAQEMIGLEHHGVFVIKVKGPHGSAGGGGGGGGGWAPPPPKADELPEVARARLTAGRTQWIECDIHAALDFKGAQMLMVAQYPRGGKTGPGALEEGGVKQDREAMAAEAGPEVAAELADLVAEDERRLKDDAKQHHEQRARGGVGGGGVGLGGAIRRALLSELAPPHEEQEEGEEEEDWAAQHHEEAEAQLRAHEAQEKEEEEEAEGRLVVDPAITGEIE
jgi:hypothetical protein